MHYLVLYFETMRLLPFLLLFVFSAPAQPLRYFTHFTEKDGLSDIQVQCLLRDQQGYLWVGTANGLNRYDGYSFRHFFPDSRQAHRTISNENIHDITQDSEGFIWFATANGLNRYDPRTETFRVWKNTGRSDGSLPNSLVLNILIDKNNHIWLACDNRDPCCFDPKTERFTIYPWKEFLGQKQPDAAGEDYKTIYFFEPRGNTGLWFMTNFGLFSFDFDSQKFDMHPAPKQLSQKKAGKYCSDAIYLGSSDSDLLHFDACTRQWSQVRLPISKQLTGGRRQVTDVFPFGKNWLVCYREGLCLLDTATLQMQPVRTGAENRSTAPTGLLLDHFHEKNGMLWLGGEQGLWLYNPAAQYFDYTPLKPASDQGIYNSFCRFLDSGVDGRRYITNFYEGKIYVLENGRLVKTLSSTGNCGILYEDREGRLWTSFGKKIFQIDRNALTIHPFKAPAYLFDSKTDSYFFSMAEDARGNFWFGNTSEGLLVWRPKTGDWWKPCETDGFISQGIRDVFADLDRRTVWIATEDYGLFRFDEKTGKFTLYRQEEADPEHSLGGYIVNAICKDGLGYIWAATDPGGVSRFDYDAPAGRQFITLNSEDGLPSNQVTSLLSDASGNVWAGTTKGLAWIDMRRLRVRAFNKSDGMITDFIDLPMALAANGEVLSGTMFGYQHFHPDSILQRKQQPGLQLTAFRVFDKNYDKKLNINFLQNINLSWKENFFSLEFASTDFSQPQKNEYAYRLKNYDANWIFLKNRHSASYTGVPPGNYLLEIKSGREGNWQEPGIQLGIHIAPPFWATWWFRGFVLILVTGIVWTLYRWRIGQVRREAMLKTEFNQRIARTEMAALRAQMNPHFVFNCLSSINRFILVNQPEEASAYLTKFSRLIRLILDNSRTETVPLNKELEALQLYVEMEQMRFNERFGYRLTVADDVQTEHLEIPPLLIQPYVENAIWHGLMHKKTPGILQVRVFYERKKLCIEVEDNGVGRHRAKELKSRSVTVNKSLGMKLTAERIEVINQLYGTSAKVETVDLVNGNGEATGTTVRICF
ncbi:MAG: histidine kinase [Lewinellaceae bacterium]|nr:histidine kinase [Lewinellaceae bacterium]